MDILKYEKTYQSRGYNNIVGIDEAGRGPLAGPVVAVSVNWGDSPLIEGVKDSKKISPVSDVNLKFFYLDYCINNKKLIIIINLKILH